MKLAERLAGAIVAGLFLASAFAQAEAVASSWNADDVAAQLADARLVLVRDVILVGHPEQQIVEIMRGYPETEHRLERALG